MFVRWDNLKIEADDATRLPGYRDGATIRRFDAPEALNIRFYEVQAKSALNRVPEASAMPFRWTINPYRGCTHACTYCVSGDAEVLMADGSTRAIAHLRRGDAIYGTERSGQHRRFVTTTVLDHWSTIKPAFRITLADGTELVAGGDHRFLTERGWKHVTGSEQGRDRRPHLTLGNSLMGVGRLARGPLVDEHYRRGYLCGLVRGDRTIGSYEHVGDGRTRTIHGFHLALSDGEALDRSRRFLEADGLVVHAGAFASGGRSSCDSPLRSRRSRPCRW